MRKGTKKIRYVNVGTGKYYVYDFDDALGKKKRLYGKTQAELEKKIEQAKQERAGILDSQKPQSNKLSECVDFYLLSSANTIKASDIKRLFTLFDNTIKNSEIDRDIEDLTATDIQKFLDKMSASYHRKNVMELYEHLQKIFELYEQKIDFGSIAINDIQPASCIITPSEYEKIISYCLFDNCTKCGQNERLILFCLFTGLTYTKVKKLNSSDIDMTKGTFMLGEIEYPLSEQCASWLREQFLSGTLNQSPLFVNGNNVSPSLQSIQTTVDVITRHLGLPKCLTSKTLPKSYIIWRIENGDSTEKLAKYFGYASECEVLNIYNEFITSARAN